jgi:Uma2 family endonuclease
MVNPAPDARWTFERAAELDQDENPGDLDRGRFIPVTKSTIRHGRIMFNIAALLRQYTKAHPEWVGASGDPGCKLEHDPDTLRGPDVALVRRERAPAGRGAEGWLDGAPELAVEILRDSQTAPELIKKAGEFLAAGTRMVWLVDADNERVTVITQQGPHTIVGRDGSVSGGELFPGLSCPVAEFFE